MYINSILSIEATFVNIMFQSRKQEDLNDAVSVCSVTVTVTQAKTDQIQGKFLKKWGVLNWSN